MALIKCPECGNTVSSEATVCIHCGYGIKKAVEEARKQEYYASDSWKNLKRKRLIIVSIVACLALLLVYLCTSVFPYTPRYTFENEAAMKEALDGTYWTYNNYGKQYPAFTIDNGKLTTCYYDLITGTYSVDGKGSGKWTGGYSFDITYHPKEGYIETYGDKYYVIQNNSYSGFCLKNTDKEEYSHGTR